MIAKEPPPGSVITWWMRYTPDGPEYQYVALRVAGRGWFTTSTKFGRALMWSEIQTLVGASRCEIASTWLPLSGPRVVPLCEAHPDDYPSPCPDYAYCLNRKQPMCGGHVEVPQ